MANMQYKHGNCVILHQCKQIVWAHRAPYKLAIKGSGVIYSTMNCKNQTKNESFTQTKNISYNIFWHAIHFHIDFYT